MKNKIILLILVIAVLGAAWITYSYYGHTLITNMYEGHSVGLLNTIIENQGGWSVDHYIEKADIAFYTILLMGLFVLFMIFASSFDKPQLKIIILSLLGVMIILVGTSKYGPGLAPDSISYISASQSLLEGKGLRNYDGSLFIHWPPLYPLLISVFNLLKIDSQLAVRILNALTFGLIIFLSGKIFQETFRSKALVTIGLICMVSSVSLLKTTVMAVTEPLFCLFILFYFITMNKYLKDRRLVNLFAVSMIVGLSCLQRYVGVTLILSGAVTIFLFNEKGKVFERTKSSLSFVVLSSIPLALWMVRNFIHTSMITGERTSAFRTLTQNVFDAINIMTLWIVPDILNVYVRFGIFILICFGIAKYLCSREDRGKDYALKTVAILFIVYSLFIIISSSLVINDRMGDRYFSPMYFPAMLLILNGLDLFFIKCNKAGITYVQKIAVCLLVIWLIYPLVRMTERMSAFLLTGAGDFNSIDWQESEMLIWLKENPYNKIMLSNAPEAIFVLTGKQSDKTPRNDHCLAQADDWQQFRTKFIKDDESIIWFKKMKRECLFDIDEIQEHLNLKVYKSFDDGAIYILQNSR